MSESDTAHVVVTEAGSGPPHAAPPDASEAAPTVVAPIAGSEAVGPEDAGSEAPRPEVASEATGSRGRPWPIVVAMLVALVTRLPLLGYPKTMVFDEVFYAPDALDTLQWGAEHGQAKHPPLGKWLIAGGIRLFGFTPFGWRFSSLVAGVLVVGLVTATVRRLTRRNGLALGVGLLAAFDGILFTTGRVAMLDVFVALFAMLVLWFLAVVWTCPAGATRRLRWAGLGAIAAAGLGCSVKWSLVWFLPIILVVLWVADRQRRPAGRRLRAGALTLALVVAVPPVLYVATWLPRQAGASPLTVDEFVRNERKVYQFHRELRPRNDNAAPATTWLWLGHPSVLFDTYCWPGMNDSQVGVCSAASEYQEARITSLANPLVWAVCMASIVGLLVLLARRRLGVAAWLLALAGTQWLPWVFNARESYSFYQGSLIPILLVGTGVVAARVERRPGRRWPVRAGTGVVAVSGALFLLFYPIWTGLPLTGGEALWRLWLPGWNPV